MMFAWFRFANDWLSVSFWHSPSHTSFLDFNISACGYDSAPLTLNLVEVNIRRFATARFQFKLEGGATHGVQTRPSPNIDTHRNWIKLFLILSNVACLYCSIGVYAFGSIV